MRKPRIIMSCLLMVLLLATSISGCSAKTKPASTEGKKPVDNYVVQLGYYNCDHMVAACVAKDAGIFDKLGVKVNVTGNGSVPEAMAAAKMDVGYVGTDGVMFAKMKGAPIFVAANNHIGGSYYFVVSNKIKNVNELLGKRVALGADAEKNNPDWVYMSKDMGIPADSKKYTNFDMANKDKFLALKTGKLDAYICCDPWGSMAEYDGCGRIAATKTTLPDGTWGTCCIYAMRDGFAKDHPELAKKMLVAHTQAMEYVYLHPLKAAKIFAKNYGVPEEVALMTIYNKTVKEGRTLTWKIDEAGMNKTYETAKQTGVGGYEQFLTADKYVNTTLLSQSGADDFDTFIKTKVDPVFPMGMSYQDYKKKAQEVDA